MNDDKYIIPKKEDIVIFENDTNETIPEGKSLQLVWNGKLGYTILDNRKVFTSGIDLKYKKR